MEPSPIEEPSSKKARALARLRRCHTTVESAKQGRVLRAMTYCPSEPPPGHTLPDRQVQTAITPIATAEGPHYLVEHTVQLPTLAHFQYFWDRPQFRALGTEVFADTKEISESVAAFRAASDAMVGRAFARAFVVAVADGGTPRTAALFAVGTDAPTVHSIDPEMRREWLVGAGGQAPAPDRLPSLLAQPGCAGRLHCHRLRVEEWIESALGNSPSSSSSGGSSVSGLGADATLVVVAVHSHVRLDAYVPALRQRLGYPHTVVVAMPCCVDQSMEMEAPPAPEAEFPNAPGLAAASGSGGGSGGEALLPEAAAAAVGDVVGDGWARTARKKRGGKGAKKRRLVQPTREYNDYGVHSNERVVRVFVLSAGGSEATAEIPLPAGLSVSVSDTQGRSEGTEPQSANSS